MQQRFSAGFTFILNCNSDNRSFINDVIILEGRGEGGKGLIMFRAKMVSFDDVIYELRSANCELRTAFVIFLKSTLQFMH